MMIHNCTKIFIILILISFIGFIIGLEVLFLLNTGYVYFEPCPLQLPLQLESKMVQTTTGSVQQPLWYKSIDGTTTWYNIKNQTGWLLLFDTDWYDAMMNMMMSPFLGYDHSTTTKVSKKQSTYDEICSYYSNTYEEARFKFREVTTLLIQQQQQQQQQQRIKNNNKNNHDDETNTNTNQTTTTILLDQMVVVPGLFGGNKVDVDGTSGDYTMDIAVVPGTAPGLVIHMSGTHGVEGYTGSAIQIAYLRTYYQNQEQKYNNNNNNKNKIRNSSITTDMGMDDKEDEKDEEELIPTMIFIHALNPFGMARYRRWNENNVDLNRNGLLLRSSTPTSEPTTTTTTPSTTTWETHEDIINHYNKDSYQLFDEFFFNPPPIAVPSFWYKYVIHWYKGMYVLYQYGFIPIKSAMVGGQYSKPSGIFYGGTKVECSISVLQQWFHEYFEKYPNQYESTIATTMIDVHTGLGKMGQDTMMATTTRAQEQQDASIIDESSYMYQQVKQWFPTSTNGMFLPKSPSIDQTTTSPPPPQTTTTTTTKLMNQFKKLFNGIGSSIKIGGIAGTFETGGVESGYENVHGSVLSYLQRTVFQHQPSSFFLTQEFGTIPGLLVSHALIIENMAYHYYYYKNQNMNQQSALNENDSNIRKQIKIAKDTTYQAFQPNSQQYRTDVLERGLRALDQAIHRTKLLSSVSVSSSSKSKQLPPTTTSTMIHNENQSTTKPIDAETTTTTTSNIVDHDEL